jgi:predicted NBD/HSP70 family sugar kinase
VELNLGSITVCIRDLGGRIVAERRIAHNTADSGSPREAIALLASVIGETVTELARDGRRLSGLTVAVPGVVDIQRGTVRFAPNLDWRDIYLLDELRTVVGPDVALWLDNEANLGALAEYRAGALAGTGNLVYLLIENGVGGGMIVNGALHRGASGAAGEVGHMTVKTVDGARCACGRRGCLETVAGLAALLELTVPAMAGEVLHDHTLNDENRTGAIAAAASRGDTAVLAGLHEWARWVGIGVANIIDLLDPDAVVLAGHPCSLAAWILPTVIEVAGANAMPGAMDTCEIVTSTLGFSAAALGGAIHAAERILADPKLIVTG